MRYDKAHELQHVSVTRIHPIFSKTTILFSFLLKNGLKWDWARARFLNQCLSRFLQRDHFLSLSPKFGPETETASRTRAQVSLGTGDKRLASGDWFTVFC